MIRHIVFFTARDPQEIDRIVEGLWKLAEIPHSDFFEVGINRKVDQLGNDVDVIVYAEFADEEALAAYKAHPIYVETTNRVQPMRDIRYAVDFVSRKQ